ncbi:hypothetical protein GCK72_024709 [Caenorhabditis remanei]|uniref:Uncharacterized protein n=1 Tax=Caenorhabditis remanei TaxID=31234 RepID=A0A6A5G0Q2_CAERE|nr:hypothetical protein GCK72_024709 [Caenorhabditis remanei]KAF1748242.1 hypothetical protein GCK72_024709 [Caenorhabditis remanei]
MTENSEPSDPPSNPFVQNSTTSKEVEITPNPEESFSKPAGIIRCAESTDDSHLLRRSSMKPSEPLDCSKHDGILKR